MEGLLIHAETEFLSHRFDFFDRIDTRRENEEDRGARIGLFVGFAEWNRSVFDELFAELLFDEQTRSQRR